MHQTKTVTIRRSRSVLVSEVCEVPLDYVVKRKIRTPMDARDSLAFLEHSAKEELWALYLNGRHELICQEQVSLGTATASLIHPREVFGPALRHGACAVVVAHNHPSGDPMPSEEDAGVTARLKEVGDLVGIPLLDHVVIGQSGSFFSIRGRGTWK